MPQYGKIQARYPTHSTTLGSQAVLWAGTASDDDTYLPYTTATAASPSTCFDNGNSAGTVQRYSIGTNGGNGINCALIFEFQ